MGNRPAAGSAQPHGQDNSRNQNNAADGDGSRLGTHNFSSSLSSCGVCPQWRKPGGKISALRVSRWVRCSCDEGAPQKLRHRCRIRTALARSDRWWATVVNRGGEPRDVREERLLPQGVVPLLTST